MTCIGRVYDGALRLGGANDRHARTRPRARPAEDAPPGGAGSRLPTNSCAAYSRSPSSRPIEDSCTGEATAARAAGRGADCGGRQLTQARRDRRWDARENYGRSSSPSALRSCHERHARGVPTCAWSAADRSRCRRRLHRQDGRGHRARGSSMADGSADPSSTRRPAAVSGPAGRDPRRPRPLRRSRAADRTRVDVRRARPRPRLRGAGRHRSAPARSLSPSNAHEFTTAADPFAFVLDLQARDRQRPRTRRPHHDDSRRLAAGGARARARTLDRHFLAVRRRSNRCSGSTTPRGADVGLDAGGKRAAQRSLPGRYPHPHPLSTFLPLFLDFPFLFDRPTSRAPVFLSWR